MELVSRYWIGEFENDELERIWKKATVDYFQILPQHLPGTTKERNESWPPGPEFAAAPLTDEICLSCSSVNTV
jgi:hypothetical protein